MIADGGDFAALAEGTPSAEHDRAARRFAAACRHGNVPALRDLLSMDVAVITDHGGKVRAPAAPIRGPAEVIGFLANLAGDSPPHVTVEQVNGRSGIVIRRAGETLAVIVLAVTEAKVVAVWMVLNPDKLRRWQDAEPASSDRSSGQAAAERDPSRTIRGHRPSRSPSVSR